MGLNIDKYLHLTCLTIPGLVFLGGHGNLDTLRNLT